MSHSVSSGPLEGVRVADFSRVLAGPLCTMQLADFGAEVIKIESPSGDDTRSWVPPVDADGTGTYFSSVNRNKRSVVADLKTPEGLTYARDLIADCDVVVENFRPGVMAKFGLDYETLAKDHPHIVYCSISGFGPGSGEDMPGYDLLVQALGGLMSITGQADSDPSKVGVALVDVLTGQNALAGILLALRVRDATGWVKRSRSTSFPLWSPHWSIKAPPLWPPAGHRAGWATPIRALLPMKRSAPQRALWR